MDNDEVSILWRKLITCCFSIVCFLSFSSFYQFSIAHIKTIKSHPDKIYDIFTKNKHSFKTKFPKMNEDELYVLFCCIASYSCAPYGECSVSTLDAMLKSSHLHCGNYGLLSIQLAIAGYPDIENKVKVHAVTWNNGPFGVHQTLFIHRSHDDGVFIDPTCGYVAIASFNEVASGKPIPKCRIFDFSNRGDIAVFRRKVYDALVNGECRPSQILAYFKSPLQHAAYYKMIYTSDTWLPTPAAKQ